MDVCWAFWVSFCCSFRVGWPDGFVVANGTWEAPEFPLHRTRRTRPQHRSNLQPAVGGSSQHGCKLQRFVAGLLCSFTSASSACVSSCFLFLAVMFRDVLSLSMLFAPLLSSWRRASYWCEVRKIGKTSIARCRTWLKSLELGA